MKVETTNLTSLSLCLTVVGIQTREIVVQVRDRNLYTANRCLITVTVAERANYNVIVSKKYLVEDCPKWLVWNSASFSKCPVYLVSSWRRCLKTFLGISIVRLFNMLLLFQRTYFLYVMDFLKMSEKLVYFTLWMS